MTVENNIRTLFSRMAYLAAGAAALLLFLTGTLVASSSGQTSTVTDVRFSVAGGQVVIHYNLLGKANATYNVSLELRKGSDSTYRYSPKAVSGDVGVGRFAGADREITWSIDEEFPQGLSGSDYYFVVRAQEVRAKSGLGFLTIVGAGVAVVAAAAYFVLSDMHATGAHTVALPAPPGRP